MEKPDITTCTDKQFEKWWWLDFHEVCKSCSKSCKQSHAIKQVSCIKYKKIEV